MTDKQIEALKLANWLDAMPSSGYALTNQAAAELRRLHEENERLRTVPMKYRRMEFNAQLQEENNRLHVLNTKLLKALFRAASALESVTYTDPSVGSALANARAAIAKAGEQK